MKVESIPVQPAKIEDHPINIGTIVKKWSQPTVELGVTFMLTMPVTRTITAGVLLPSGTPSSRATSSFE